MLVAKDGEISELERANHHLATQLRNFAALFDTHLSRPPSSAVQPIIVAATPVVQSPTAVEKGWVTSLPGLLQPEQPGEDNAWAFRPDGSFRLTKIAENASSLAPPRPVRATSGAFQPAAA